MNLIPTSGLTFKIHRKPAVPVASVADAAAKWSQYRDETMKGVSQIGNGGIVRDGKRIVARVSYNGRIWEERQSMLDPATNWPFAYEKASRELRPGSLLALRAQKGVG